MYAAQSLGGLGTAAATAGPALAEALQDEEVGGFGFRVCDKAAWALKRVRGEEAAEPDYHRHRGRGLSPCQEEIDLRAAAQAGVR
jgi:hypothetical protein